MPFQLSREVRFAVPIRVGERATADGVPGGEMTHAPVPAGEGRPGRRVRNGHGGSLDVDGRGHGGSAGAAVYYELRLTLRGPVDPASGYVCNIKLIDDRVRRVIVPTIADAVNRAGFCATKTLVEVYTLAADLWPGLVLAAVEWRLSPYLIYSVTAEEAPLVRLSRKFEFSAAHRLHNPDLSDEENRQMFGKCNNPGGHGHNYELQVTLTGRPDDDGQLMGLDDLEAVVDDVVLQRLDHKHLNDQVEEFANLNPSVENISKVIFDLLAPVLRNDDRKLASVTVWETPKTWCEYSGD